jgi:hypothetical protein
MPVAYKILGQSAPATTSNADLYTVPSATQTVVSSIVVCNTTALDATARIFIRNNAAAAAASNAIIYDATISANSTAGYSLGITIDATDVITVRSSTANAITFSAFGSETT